MSQISNNGIQGWDWISTNRQEIADEAMKLAENLPSNDRLIVINAANFFKGSSPVTESVHDPDILTLCIPFLTANVNERSVERIPLLLKEGFCLVAPALPARGRFRKLFLSPILVCVGFAVVAMLFCAFVLLPLHEVILEFQIVLPYLATIVFKTAKLLSLIAVPVACLFFGALIWLVVKNWIARSKRLVGDHWLDHYFKSRRSQAAGWAWHMHLLLLAGFEADESVEIAGGRQRGWLNKISCKWSESPQSFGARYQLLDTTMAVANPYAQIELFRETARFYWEQSHTLNNWWASWLVYFLYFLIISTIVVMAVSVFSTATGMLSGLGGF